MARDSSSDKSRFENSSIEEALEELDADPEEGLDEDEAKRRLERTGPNTIEEEKQSWLVKLLSHFWGPIPWMIEAAVILAAVAQRWEDFGVILTMLLINVGVGFWHEKKAGDAIEALKSRLSPEARVVRQGETETIEASGLVPGDVVVLRMGDVMPADAKLLHDQHLQIDESSLTGESLPVSKQEGDSCYSGTTIKRGEARAVVTATGRDTRFARTVELVESAESVSHFQKAVLRIGYFLIGVTAFLVLTVVTFSVTIRQDPWVHVLLFALGLTLAGIPQALPAVLSVTMSVGAARLARMKAIVARLAAMEEMAGLQVLCADKTGTLTKNELEIQDPVLLESEDQRDLLRVAALTTREQDDDPIDVAVRQALGDVEELKGYEVTDFRPFDPTRKRAEADIRREGESFTAAKGAPQAILELTEPGDELRRKVNEQVDELGDKGLRALGVARKDSEGWRYLGILPMMDPPREDSADVIAEAQGHGIDIRMVTGDHLAIGRQVAQMVGLRSNLVRAADVVSEEEEARALDEERLLDADGFAEVTPEHKFQIIQAFQAEDRIVGMTGDGVNDAPALQQADVGIAVSGATDAARSAAHLVLTEPGLGVITRAIEEARRIFERMTSYATFRITESLRVLLFVAASVLIAGFYPVTPIMIVLLAILNDIPIMTIAWDNAATADHPVRWDMRRVLTIASVLAVTGVISSFVLFYIFRHALDVPHEQVQTVMFLKLLVAGHLTIFLTRSRGWMWQRPWPSLSLFLTLEGTQVVGTLVAVYGVLVEPIGWSYALIVWGYALVWIVFLDAVKVGVQRLLDRARS